MNSVASRSTTVKVRKAINAYKKANPATAKAIENYKKLKTARALSTGVRSGYRTDTSTKLSSVFTTR